MGFFSFVNLCGATGWLILALGLFGVAIAGWHVAKPAARARDVLRGLSCAITFLVLAGLGMRVTDGILATMDDPGKATAPFALLLMPGVLNLWVLGFGLLGLAWIILTLGELRAK